MGRMKRGICVGRKDKNQLSETGINELLITPVIQKVEDAESLVVQTCHEDDFGKELCRPC